MLDSVALNLNIPFWSWSGPNSELRIESPVKSRLVKASTANKNDHTIRE